MDFTPLLAPQYRQPRIFRVVEGNWTRWVLLCYYCRLDGWLYFAAQECRLCGQETVIDGSLKSTFREDECMEVSQLVTDSVRDLVPSPRLEASHPKACFTRMLPVAPLGTRLCFMRRELSLGFVRYLPTGVGRVSRRTLEVIYVEACGS